MPPRRTPPLEYLYTTVATRLGRSWRGALIAAPGVLLLATLCGCPAYQDDLSGTFVEVRDDALSEEVFAIDYFRFGDYSNAIVRTYRAPQSAPPEALLDDPISCQWTELGDAPDDEKASWRLKIEREPTWLNGTFLDADTLELTLQQSEEDGSTTTTTKTLLRYRDQPDNACEVIRPFYINPNFTTPNDTLTQAGYTLRQPVFGILWLGVQARYVGDVLVWVAKNDLTDAFFLSDKPLLERDAPVDRPKNLLQNGISLSISPPPERALSSSGQTRYALAHFVVIDDHCEDATCSYPSASTRFAWELASEPIIASSLQRGNEVDSPFPDATGLGKALLFVEGSLDQLHPDLRSLLINLDRYDSRRANAHFYILDIFFDDKSNVIGLRLPDDPNRLANPAYRSLVLETSAQYLDSAQIRLPRLLPLDSL